MKLVIILLLVLGGAWLWRRARLSDMQAARRNAAGLRPALPMVRCAHCGVHVPTQEAVAGQRGSYCGAAHRRKAEGGV